MSDVYKTPEATLTSDEGISDFGSIEKGVTGNYEFAIGDTLKEAWAKTDGAKGTFNLAFALYFIVAIVIMMALNFLMVGLMSSQPQGEPSALMVVAAIGQQVIMNLAILPLVMGVFILAIRRSVDAPIEATSIFGYYSKAIPLLITVIIMYIMLMIGFVLLIIPGIYLSVSYMLAMPLVVEKGLSPWQALETSRKAITRRWFSIFGFMLLIGLIVAISAIPLGIPLIWTVPMMMIAYGILYRNIFGVEAMTVQ